MTTRKATTARARARARAKAKAKATAIEEFSFYSLSTQGVIYECGEGIEQGKEPGCADVVEG
jgi:hypothetical protein